jgi:hypothetical protein
MAVTLSVIPAGLNFSIAHGDRGHSRSKPVPPLPICNQPPETEEVTLKDILFITGLLGVLALTILLLKLWLSWRKRAITRVAQTLGFCRLEHGENFPVVLVPLVERRGQNFFLILKGRLHDYESAFFDLYHRTGKNWDFQSTVLVKDPGLDFPKFQLRPKTFLQTSPKRCAFAVELPAVLAAGLELSSEDPEWAQLIFAQVSPDFLRKVRRSKWSIEGRRGSLVLYRLGTRIAPRNWEKYVTDAGDLVVELFAYIRQSASLFA